MAHEICHMFGLRHCIYYECLMNGTMSASELARKHNHTICPVCLKKLKINLKLDTKNWLTAMQDVATKLGFAKEASAYEKILSQLSTL